MKLSTKTETALLIAGIVAIYIFLIAGSMTAAFALHNTIGETFSVLVGLALGLGTLVPFSVWLANRLS